MNESKHINNVDGLVYDEVIKEIGEDEVASLPHHHFKLNQGEHLFFKIHRNGRVIVSPSTKGGYACLIDQSGVILGYTNIKCSRPRIMLKYWSLSMEVFNFINGLTEHTNENLRTQSFGKSMDGDLKITNVAKPRKVECQGGCASVTWCQRWQTEHSSQTTHVRKHN